ncbi:MAG: nicotinate-nucleotide adenylyltransferase [Amphritea sp.]|nr:nicotinate-nucleotide adenylyltransferase [Amphritea sp.]
MRNTLPYARSGQVIGLLGGSFDPAHEGHAHISREAMKRFGLQQVWWLMSPGNPLKTKGPASVEQRIEHAKKVVDHPRIVLTALETQLGTRYTAETLARLQMLYPGVRFVWLMGADNLAQFHLWRDWQDIMARVPVAVLARPGDRLAARCSKAARLYRAARLAPQQSHTLPYMVPPRWCFMNIPMAAQSSSQIRAKGHWPKR